MSAKIWMARQGDVFLMRIAKLPDGLVPCPRETGGRNPEIVLARGEATGHTHAIAEPEVELLARPGETTGDAAERWLRVQGAGATVVHEEHGAITLAPGFYRVIRQREFTDDDDPLLVSD